MDKAGHSIPRIRWGEDWFSNADTESYDVVIQMALLGEIRYG